MTKKLKSKKGASLLMALVVFLTATFVSIVLISASLTSIKRVKDDRAEKENYLAVSSASRLIAKKLTSATVQKKVDRTDHGNEVDYPSTGDFGPILSDMLQHAGSGSARSYDITLTSGGEADMTDCKLEIEMSEGVASPEVTPGQITESYKITGVISTVHPPVEDAPSEGEQNEYKVYFTSWLTSVATVPGANANQTITTYQWSGIDMSTVNPE